MTLRRRVGLATAAVVGITIVVAACVTYFVVRGQLRGQVDSELRAQAALVERGAGLEEPFPEAPASAGGPAPYMQVVLADGATYHRQGDIRLPVSSQVLAVAAGNMSSYSTDIYVGGSHLRELTVATPFTFDGQRVAVQLARPLSSVDNVLGDLRLILLLVILGGIALAAVLGRLAANRVLAPLAEVADTAEHIGETEDLSSRIAVRADDEVGQLATRFNTMVERLELSRDELAQAMLAQRQLVADASHELRTPVTSLRMNIEMLLADEGLSEDDRRRMLADVVEQTEELSALVNDLIELARGDLPVSSPEDIRLDRLAADSVDRARRNFPEISFEERLEPVVVEGDAERLSRALNNLLDNAARHSPAGTAVELEVDGDGIRVRDHGPGIDPDDLPHVFDRFYRGVSARGRQGSGLGLAIVRQVAEQHGGSVGAANAPDGGAQFTLRLPAVAADVRAEASGNGAPDDASLARGPEAVA